MLGAVEVSYTGATTAVLLSGGIEDDLAGYSASIPFSMPMSMANTDPRSGNPPLVCTVASAGLMVGKPDPMEGFPSTVAFSVFGIAHNLTLSSLTIHGIANYMDNIGPHNLQLTDITLQPGETKDLNLARLVKFPFQDGDANFSFSYRGPCDSLLLETGSVDATGNYVFEVEPELVGKSWGRISHYWQAGAGTDTMYTIWNPSSQPEDLSVTLFYGQIGGTYKYKVHLDPNSSKMFSVMDLIQKAVPDSNGDVIPTGTTAGSLTITNSVPDLRSAVTFVMSGGIYNPIAGTCCQNPTICTGATSANLSPASASVPAGSSLAAHFFVTDSSGNQQDYSSAATWNSNNSAVLAVEPGTLMGIAPGVSYPLADRSTRRCMQR